MIVHTLFSLPRWSLLFDFLFGLFSYPFIKCSFQVAFSVLFAQFRNYGLQLPVYISFVLFCIYRDNPKLTFVGVCVVFVIVARFIAYGIMLWSVLLSSLLMLQSVILRSTLLVASVKSTMLLRTRFPNVVLFHGSFIICICLLITYSSRCFPLLFVVVSCPVLELALLSIAMKNPPLIQCFSILSTLVRIFRWLSVCPSTCSLILV